ncbi:hypothetical protein JTE90_007037 [Oedothorax gibbosus]|uniref:Uncharacterized protein n=1 Tax=Oedothorax gibbosus TaxID=931172 RepID=A0AAV6U6C8_9ARAC|nr:hypothetical protein JTE90_007037 [Oedothorax gibbosus]
MPCFPASHGPCHSHNGDCNTTFANKEKTCGIEEKTGGDGLTQTGWLVCEATHEGGPRSSSCAVDPNLNLGHCYIRFGPYSIFSGQPLQE